MSADSPDSKTIRTALTMAVRAPSVHNTQPWLWRVAENSVHLYSNPSLRIFWIVGQYDAPIDRGDTAGYAQCPVAIIR